MKKLERLVAEASVLAGGAHVCAQLGHAWEALGGRACPRGGTRGSQTVYECRACGEIDYGAPGGPGWRECYGTGEPCRRDCMEG